MNHAARTRLRNLWAGAVPLMSAKKSSSVLCCVALFVDNNNNNNNNNNNYHMSKHYPETCTSPYLKLQLQSIASQIVIEVR